MNALPPSDVDAETATLGACIQSPAMLATIRQTLTAGDFYRPAAQTVYATMCDLADEGINPDRQLVIQRLIATGMLPKVGGHMAIVNLADKAPTVANGPYYAAKVKFTARQRAAVEVGQRITEDARRATDRDQLLDRLAGLSLQLQMFVDEPDDGAPVPGLTTWDGFLNHRRTRRWLVPGLISSQDVLMTIAPAGAGKSFLSRQVCMCLAAGVHPFHPGRRIEPVRTLLIDLENADEELADESHAIKAAVAARGDWDPDRAHLWHHVEGLDIRRAADAQLLERAVAESGAKFVALGSLYNAFTTGRDTWDVAAMEARDVFNRIRARYGVAWLIEHHMPRGRDGHPAGTPFGSTVWERWPTHGRMLNRIPNTTIYEFAETFRGDRGKRELPAGLYRGGDLPWSAVWDQEEVELAKEGAKR